MNLFNDSFVFFVILTLFGLAFTALAEDRWFDNSGNALALTRMQSTEFVQRHIEQQRQEAMRRHCPVLSAENATPSCS